jgi:hypothetical protein
MVRHFAIITHSQIDRIEIVVLVQSNSLHSRKPFNFSLVSEFKFPS